MKIHEPSCIRSAVFVEMRAVLRALRWIAGRATQADVSEDRIRFPTPWNGVKEVKVQEPELGCGLVFVYDYPQKLAARQMEKLIKMMGDENPGIFDDEKALDDFYDESASRGI